MKQFSMKMMFAALLISLFALTSCAEKDHMEMDAMDKGAMQTEMKDEAKMMDDDMVKPMKEEMMDKSDTMKSDMDVTMDSGMKKME